MWPLSYGVAIVGRVLILPSGRDGSTGDHFTRIVTGKLFAVRIGWSSPANDGEIHQLGGSTGNDRENLARHNASLKG